MKLKELFNRVRNSSNNQSVWNPKKRKLKENNLSEEDILEMKIDPKLKKILLEDNN